MACISRRLFLIAPPAAAAALFLRGSEEGLEALDAPPLAGAHHASGAPAKGFRHANLKGWVTIVHALAGWRPECADEIALWRAVGQDTRFQIAGLFVRDSEADALAFIARHGNPYDVLAFDSDGAAGRQLGVDAPPTTFIFGAHGQVIHTVRGPVTREHFERVILPIIIDASPITPLLA
ncbi:MAG: redoxin family protein [Beijerinckiaceae bacterium]|nr:redoxin family protein [Beijerinckiaceae bacterium]